MRQATEARRLLERIREELGSSTGTWIAPRGRDSVALAVLDAIYSTGNRYSGVLNALARYRAARIEEGADPDSDTAEDLVAAVDRWGGPEGLVARTNRWRTSTKVGAPTKAEAAYAAARLLLGHGLNTSEDVRAELSDPAAQEVSPIKRAWLALPGQRSGLTWTYFLMLCRVQGVKGDRMIVRYVSRAVGRPVPATVAATLVAEAAQDLGITPIHLDHVIWRLESGRPVQAAPNAT